jgi:tetratricopeptide (TPR) repeat protein
MLLAKEPQMPQLLPLMIHKNIFTSSTIIAFGLFSFLCLGSCLGPTSAYSGQIPKVDSPFSLPADFDPSAIESSPVEKPTQNSTLAKEPTSADDQGKNTGTDQETKKINAFTEENDVEGQEKASESEDLPNKVTASEKTQAKEKTPAEFATEYVSQAMDFYKKGNLAKAEAMFARAAFIEPANAKLWNNLGLIRRKQKKIEQAIAAYERAIKADPDYALAHKNLAVALEKKKDYKKAARAYLRYAELAPSAKDSHTARKRAEWLARK